MQKPQDPGSNVHFLNLPAAEVKAGDVLGTLFHALKGAKERRQDNAAAPASNDQQISGDGNIQMSAQAMPNQSIAGNNNIQIGAVQLVVQVTMNVKR